MKEIIEAVEELKIKNRQLKKLVNRELVNSTKQLKFLTDLNYQALDKLSSLLDSYIRLQKTEEIKRIVRISFVQMKVVIERMICVLRASESQDNMIKEFDNYYKGIDKVITLL